VSGSAAFEPGARSAAGIPLCVPEIRGREAEYVGACLDTGWVSSAGAFVDRFEEELARATQTRHAVALVNGTAALHVALLCAGVAPGDEVLVSTLTFIAPANAIRYAGAHPVFIDADAATWQMDPAAVSRFLAEECELDGTVLRDKRTRRRVRAVLPVDILGHPVDLDPILARARAHGLAVVEDATESLGSRYRDEPTGRRADAACFSFNGNKLITTGGGGAIVTDDSALAQRARHLSMQAKVDPVEYVHGEVGFNYRLTNVQAAIGVAQLENFVEFVAVKRANAARYAALLADVPGITLMPQAAWASSTFWLYTILVDEQRFGMSSRALLRRLASANIQTRPLWQPMHRSPAHAGERAFGGSVADALHRDALCLPSSVGLRADELEAVVREIRAACG